MSMASSSSSPTSKPLSASLWKGKARAAEPDYNDLAPTITYRHLLSHNLGVKDPLRVVALCDSDAFYAACEQIRLGLDPALPLVVQQWDSLIAVNYPARKYGISRMDKIKDAKKRCPELVVVHVATYKEGEKEPGYWENPDTHTHKVSLDHYRRESMKIISMFKQGLPTGEIEKASVDEAFIDFTQPVRDAIIARHPHLASVPPDAPHGADTPLPPPPPILWHGLGTVVPIASICSEDNVEPTPGTAVVDDGEDNKTTTWHDVALSIAAELMDKIREDIRTKLGYTTSAGIARNKFLAKLTASHKKPNGQSILRNAAIPGYLRPMAFQKIRFLGGKLGKALAEQYDVSTVGDLLTIGLDEMQRKFGEESIWVYEILRGIDRSEVKEKSVVTKSMLASKNLPQPITQASQGHHWIRVLAAELALRLNEARDADPALWPKSLVLHIRHGYDAFRSKQSVFPFTRNVSVDTIAAAGDKLWRDLLGPPDATRTTPLRISNVQLSFSGIEAAEAGQRSIEGFFSNTSVSPVAGVKRKRDFQAEDDDSTLPGGSSSPASSSCSASFVCARCKRRVALPDALSESGIDDALKADALASLRVEHADFHLAQDLARSDEGEGAPRAIRASDSKPPLNSKNNKSSKTGPGKRKTEGSNSKPTSSERQGIARFFGKKQ